MNQTRLFAYALISAGLIAIAVSLAYFAYQLGQINSLMPQYLERLDNVVAKITPVIGEIDQLQRTIKPMISEIQNLQKTTAPQLITQIDYMQKETIPNILEEVHQTREQMPHILEQIELTRKTLPAVLERIDQVTLAADVITVEIGKLRETIPDILIEVEQTREAIPDMLDRADQLIGKAETISQHAGEGAVSGVVKGVITAPLDIISGMGKSTVEHMGIHDTSDMTETDFQMVGDAIEKLAKKEEIGAVVNWDNPESGNTGEHKIVRQYEKDGHPCKTISGHIRIKANDAHDGQVEICRQPDGTWVTVEKKLQ